MRYEIDAEGDALGGEVLFDMTGAPGEDAIDGLKVDTVGNLYVCGPRGVWILSPEGRHLGTLSIPEAPHNPAWGDADGRTLYITALTEIEEYTDTHHAATVPHTLVLAPGLVIEKVYVGFWYWGRPSPYQLWEDLQGLFRRIKPDFDPTLAEIREEWLAAH
jgi:hypothetical protein